MVITVSNTTPGRLMGGAAKFAVAAPRLTAPQRADREQTCAHRDGQASDAQGEPGRKYRQVGHAAIDQTLPGGAVSQSREQRVAIDKMQRAARRFSSTSPLLRPCCKAGCHMHRIDTDNAER
jgi:hypothetical protein